MTFLVDRSLEVASARRTLLYWPLASYCQASSIAPRVPTTILQDVCSISSIRGPPSTLRRPMRRDAVPAVLPPHQLLTMLGDSSGSLQLTVSILLPKNAPDGAICAIVRSFMYWISEYAVACSLNV